LLIIMGVLLTNFYGDKKQA